MTKSFTPSFKSITKVATAFTTNNPTMEDNQSGIVTIVELSFNEITRSIEATGSDNRKRQCRVDRLADDKMVKALTKKLQEVLDNATPVRFLAAGGASANVWFYNVV